MRRILPEMSHLRAGMAGDDGAHRMDAFEESWSGLLERAAELGPDPDLPVWRTGTWNARSATAWPGSQR
jgi:hypothetical protein